MTGPSASNVHRELYEAEGYLAGIRSYTDKLWFVLEYALRERELSPDDALNKGREYVFELLQCVGAAEEHLLEARRGNTPAQRIMRLERERDGYRREAEQHAKEATAHAERIAQLEAELASAVESGRQERLVASERRAERVDA